MSAGESTIQKRESEAVQAPASLDTAPLTLRHLLVALDASDHANRALGEALRLVGSSGGRITGIHAYAAKLHDRRFRQMEGGLPERYRKEAEMEHQREVHDDLITRGLGVISDSYHDVAIAACQAAEIPYGRLSPEGKNYRRLVEAASGGEFDLLAMGALGLGAVPGAAVGSVCERVVRRAPIDVLVIREPERAIGEGPLVVGLDGSVRSFGALKTALDLARRLKAEVHAVAAYDPYFHYVAFNKISDVLSEEAGQTFRFKEQEKLHEEIIDSGIAKIYQAHLDVARAMAEAEGMALQCRLLEGKPFRAIRAYLEESGASLLLIGKTGIHADPELDIGSNAENLLRMAPCHVWLGQVTATPPMEAIARKTISWTEEAEVSMERVPETARAMVRMAILRFAQESGHTVVTSAVIEEATNRFCPERGGMADAMEESADARWAPEALALLERAGDAGIVTSIRLQAEKRARRMGSDTIAPEHVRPFLEADAAPRPEWSAAALARLNRVPEMVRGAVRRRVEASAQEAGTREIAIDLVEAAIAESRQVMGHAMQAGGHGKGGRRSEDDGPGD
jgi:nucleotide-binding universal stress UspA family protein